MRWSELDCQPADMSWKAGVDVLSFGATKNGALAVEAVIFFDTGLARDFLYRRKRGAQHLSKGRFLGAQMLAYLDNGLWLDNARHANRLARGSPASSRTAAMCACRCRPRLTRCSQSCRGALHEALIAGGARYHEWPGEGPGTDVVGKDEIFVRFVTSFQTTEKDVDALAGLLEKLSG